ncbi:MAG: SGNH/GDSL hydrolase family protein [Ilumatobacteraceae bacterium]
MRKQLVRSARYVVVAAMVTIATAPSTADATLGAPSITGAAPAAFTPLTPCRLVDTRTDPVQRVDEGTIRLQVTGACDIPATASAVAITVVATATTQEGFVAAYPSSAARPLASVLNYSAGDTRANGTILALSPAGQIDLHTSTVAALVIDTTGYFSPTPDGAATAGRFVPLPPTRLVDTRAGGGAGKLEAGSPFVVSSPGNVPADAIAVAVNLTAVEPERSGYLSVSAAGLPAGDTSVLNFPAAGQPRAATTIVPVDARGFAVLAQARTHLLVDISGYFTGPSAASGTDGLLVAISPTRLLDTRTSGAPIYAQGGIELATPADAAVVVLNVTMIPTGPGWLAAVPAGTIAGTPAVSATNAGQANRPVANMAVSPTSGRGVEVYSAVQSQVVVDLNAYFTGTPMTATIAPRGNTKPVMPAVGGCLSGPAPRDSTGRWFLQTVNTWSKIGYYPGTGPSGPVVVVGDSLTWQSIIPAMNTLIDRGYGPICLDGVISRSTLSGSASITSARSGIERIKASHPFWRMPAVRWVVAMGTNDIAVTNTNVAATRQRIDGIVAAIGSGDHLIGWINLRTRRGAPWTAREDVFNQQIAATPGVYTIDWASLVAPSPASYVWQADLIHLTVLGQQARSDLTATQLDQH